MKITRSFGRLGLAGSLIVTLTGAAPAAAKEPPVSADVIFYHGKFLTMDARSSVAQAVAVQGGKIIAVGTDAAVRRTRGTTTRMVDMNGQTVVPGFIDGHVHPQVAITMKGYLDAHYVVIPTLAGMLAATRERARGTPAGGWVTVAGTSSNQNYWPEKRMPTKAELDEVGEGRPVLYINGPHTWVVNTAGLAKLGVKPGVANLRGALIELDPQGNPTGVIREGTPLSPDIRLPVEVLQRYEQEDIPNLMLPLGYTSINNIMALPNYAAVRDMAIAGKRPKVRTSITVFADSGGHHLPQDLEALKLPDSVDPAWYRFAGIKIWADGDVPVRTGYLFGHYADEPDNHGLATNTQDELDALAARVHKAGLGMFVHSTGDRANVMILDAYEKAQRQGGPKTLMRIEHLGEFMLGPKVLERSVRLGIQGNIQPGWIWTLGDSTRKNLGEDVARAHAFRFRTIIRAGLKPGFGTDMTGFQRGTENPFMHIEAMLTRTQKDGQVFMPEEAVTLDQALRVMTIWSALSMGEEASKGSLEVGKFADMIVLSQDITRTRPDLIDGIEVRQTWVGGELMYARVSSKQAVSGF